MEDLYELVKSITSKSTCISTDFIEKLLGVLSDYEDIYFSSWHPDLKEIEGCMYHTFTKKVLLLPEKYINGYGSIKYIEPNHFIIQVFRITIMEPPTLQNLLLIAAYNGFLQRNLKSDSLPEGLVKAYKTLQMHNLINYIPRDEYNDLLKNVPDDLYERVKSLKND